MLRSLRAFAPAIVWAVAVWLIGGMQDTPSVPGGLGLDKVAHFTMYGVLGFLLARGWSATGRPRWWPVPLLLALLLGVADEMRQLSVPGRSGEAADWIADTAGASLGMYVALRMARRRRPTDRT